MFFRGILVSIAVLMIFVILLVNSAYAEENKIRIEPSLNIYYDDNITYERNSHNKKSDVISEPEIYISYRTGYPFFIQKSLAV